MSDQPAAAAGASRERLGLSGKLLLLTLLFVMIAEVLIYVPSVANFRLNWLRDRLSAAYTAALVFETAPNDNGAPGTFTQWYRETWNAQIVASAMRFELKGGTSAAVLLPGSVVLTGAPMSSASSRSSAEASAQRTPWPA